MEVRFNIFNKRVVLKLDWRDIRTDTVAGYTNRCKDGKYIVMLDYDNMELDWVVDELKFLQKEFDLGEFFIFESSIASFHAVCLDKVTVGQYLNILSSSSVDPKYALIPFKFGRKLWTLRVSAKSGKVPKYRFKIRNKAIVRMGEISSPHMELIKSLFKVYEFDLTKREKDGLDSLILAKYEV